ncbi:hypothetical protein LbFV_ORF98 [Leptopilina boulardi filamentous virus]|uniref:Uncharacterized protein n=1 Tax=Leptopilina boulardi filamentous virus TaxID=552509 RepID=A0A1S5YDD8_9VIRU|nr:hypothetical protein LbFV_ORF98 [Leptopilina boulardi filamentous virus]AQQ80018.1 hypothetical protein LbFV_ORF98 [Leptopilina boulardi filamentous virus]
MPFNYIYMSSENDIPKEFIEEIKDISFLEELKNKVPDNLEKYITKNIILNINYESNKSKLLEIKKIIDIMNNFKNKYKYNVKYTYDKETNTFIFNPLGFFSKLQKDYTIGESSLYADLLFSNHSFNFKKKNENLATRLLFNVHDFSQMELDDIINYSNKLKSFYTEQQIKNLISFYKMLKNVIPLTFKTKKIDPTKLIETFQLYC